jgi:hypothetical protein
MPYAYWRFRLSPEVRGREGILTVDERVAAAEGWLAAEGARITAPAWPDAFAGQSTSMTDVFRADLANGIGNPDAWDKTDHAVSPRAVAGRANR